ncbi:MAG: DUF1254 domain-containing protein [Polyangiaceae bacterium]|nr:DUF1254 domain-containing protein [Polyangiaceae bacterium]
MPSIETAAKLFDHLDFTHAVQTFMNAFQAVSTFAIRRGLLDVGLRDHDVLLFSGLMDSSSLFLTANCDTVYFITFLDVERGPVVMEVPPNVLGVVDDMWFRWVTDVGVPGPDRGQGGRYLFLPSEYDGPLPEGGYFVSRSRTNRLLVLGRAFLQNDDPAPAVTAIKRGLRIYPYRPGATGSSVASFLQGRGTFARLAPPAPPMKFAEGTGLSINTIPPNDATFFTMLDAAVQAEPADALDEELAGPLAAIGIVKGKRFHPDARMTKILTEAVALGNATSRTLGLRARDEEGFRYYDRTSAWMNPLMPGGYEFLRPPPRVGKTGVELAPNPGARLLNARTQFFYVATGVTPAMAMTMAGIGSQYLGAFTDSQGRPFDGAKYYRVVLPRNIPAAQFWSLTLYDNQTRSMLQTDQRFPRAGSQGYPSPAATPHADGSTAIYFGPARPTGVPEGNWIQTLPGKGWFVALRLYSPLEPFFDKSWRPSEVDEMT